MSKFVTQAGWQDAPHLSESAKEELWASIPPYQRQARSKGIPQLGSGAIYQVAEEDVVVEPFAIPSYWPRAYGLDVGWNKTAAVFLAHDQETNTAYVYHEYYRGHAEPAIHTTGIKAVAGDWMHGVIDPAARGRGQSDGRQLYQSYVDLGLTLSYADNGVEAGIFAVWRRYTEGKLKIFKSCTNLLAEQRLYRRDENGAVVKLNDHLMDSLRYGIVSGISVAALMPDYIDKSGFSRQTNRHVIEYDALARDKTRVGQHVSDYDALARR